MVGIVLTSTNAGCSSTYHNVTPPSERLPKFFAKPSAVVVKLNFFDFFDDRQLTHSVFPGVVSALYLGQLIHANSISLTGFPKKLVANASST